MKKLVLSWVALVALLSLVIVMPAGAAEKYKPFILGSNGPGDFVTKIEEVKASLGDEGFSVAGEYSPYQDAHVIAITNSQLKALGDSSDGGAYLMVLRVSVARAGGMVQVAYMNPVYYQYAYRMKEDFSSIAKKLETALGNVESFGADGMSARKLKKYHYTFGMEYFDEPLELASYGSHDDAIKTIERNLKNKAGGTGQVFRVDSPSGNVTAFGVSLSEGYSADEKIMSVIDFQELKQLAHLPYEIIVRDGSVYALSARYRIAIDFPDLSMMGDNSFMKITKAPDAIEAALSEVAGGDYDAPSDSSDFF